MAICLVKSCSASQSQAHNKQKLDSTRVELLFFSGNCTVKGKKGMILSRNCVRSDYRLGGK